MTLALSLDLGYTQNDMELNIRWCNFTSLLVLLVVIRFAAFCIDVSIREENSNPLLVTQIMVLNLSHMYYQNIDATSSIPYYCIFIDNIIKFRTNISDN